MRTTVSLPKQLKTVLIIYVDDMLLSGRHTGELTELVRKLWLKFGMKDLGPARHILRMKISRNHAKRQLFLSQTDYIGRVFDRLQPFRPDQFGLLLSDPADSNKTDLSENLLFIPVSLS